VGDLLGDFIGDFISDFISDFIKRRGACRSRSIPTCVQGGRGSSRAMQGRGAARAGPAGGRRASDRIVFVYGKSGQWPFIGLKQAFLVQPKKPQARQQSCPGGQSRSVLHVDWLASGAAAGGRSPAMETRASTRRMRMRRGELFIL
jgi:hypothetical protein